LLEPLDDTTPCGRTIPNLIGVVAGLFVAFDQILRAQRDTIRWTGRRAPDPNVHPHRWAGVRAATFSAALDGLVDP
jgi:hypothetical protein